jgi:sortase A
MRDHRYVQDLTIEELEQELLIRRREERLARLRRMGASGRLGRTVIVQDELDAPAQAEPFRPGVGGNWAADQIDGSPETSPAKNGFQVWRDRILLAIEGAALVGLIAVVISLLANVRSLNREAREQLQPTALPNPSPTALIRALVLPGGHSPPSTPGGEAQAFDPVPQIAIPTPGPRSPTRLVISSINLDVPVVEGDDAEQLKKGAGHHIGSANPGERGNCFLSGHNDIYGEIFRDLEQVRVGDEIVIYAGEQPYRYVVRATRIVEPDDVSIMYPTTTPVLTLLTCYPYMVDTQRLVVIAELNR